MSPETSVAMNSQNLRAQPAFTEKTFYLEEFYGKSLLFALVPPVGQRMSDFDSLLKTLRELRRNQTRCIVIVSPSALPLVMRRMGKMAPHEAPIIDPTSGLRTRPYPPDSAVAKIWHALKAGSIVVASTIADDSEDLMVFAQELASRLRVFKLILLDRGGGLVTEKGERMSFVEAKSTQRAMRRANTKLRRKIVRLAAEAIKDGVGSVNLVSQRYVYEELFSFTGLGTLFTPAQYGTVGPISIDDFEEVEALIMRAQDSGFLLPRSADQIAEILPSCFGYRVGDEHLAGICSLLTDPYRRDHAGEITALHTLTRFQGEGVALELVKEVIWEAMARQLKYVFACTSEERAARFFRKMKFRRVGPKQVSSAKWRDYDSERIGRLSIFRFDLE